MSKSTLLIICAIIGTALANDCPCPKIYNPVCGSNLVTYENQCQLTCEIKKSADLKLLKNGKCDNIQKEDKPCRCSRMYSPVCGSDGVTYDNECQFQCKVDKTKDYVLKMDHVGECKKEIPCICNKMRAPVCGTDGITYGNKCELECKALKTPNLKVAHLDVCEKKSEMTCKCPFIYAPVCASNKATYDNKCAFECFKDNYKNSHLKIDYDGKCKETTMDLCACPDMYDPVCTSDGKTYANSCEFHCYLRLSKNFDIHIVKNEQC